MSVTTVPPGLSEVQARISTIQARIGALGAGRTGASTLDTGLGISTQAATGGFADSLASALGSDGTGSTTDASPVAAATGAAPTPAGAEVRSPTGVGAVGTAAIGASAVDLAKEYLGVPYRWGGTNPATGLDCSGLTQLVYGRLGISLPRVSADQAKVGQSIPSLDQARPGDLLFFHDPVSHVAIYAGGGRMVEAPHTGAVVRVSDISATPSHIRRVTGGLAPTTSPGATAAGGGTPYADVFRSEGARSGVSPRLLAAVAKTESGFRTDAVSPAGARGLMQLMPATARGLGVDPDDPRQAVRGAATLLAGYLKTYGGDVDAALAAYNAGPAAVKTYGGVPPYPETTAYVRSVRTALQEVAL